MAFLSVAPAPYRAKQEFACRRLRDDIVRSEFA
jgi:hypothetical protein